MGNNLDSVPLRCKIQGLLTREEVVVYIVHEEFLIGIGGRKLILVKYKYLPKL